MIKLINKFKSGPRFNDLPDHTAFRDPNGDVSIKVGDRYITFANDRVYIFNSPELLVGEPLEPLNIEIIVK